jgi:uncharacterized protein YkwD
VGNPANQLAARMPARRESSICSNPLVFWGNRPPFRQNSPGGIKMLAKLSISTFLSLCLFGQSALALAGDSDKQDQSAQAKPSDTAASDTAASDTAKLIAVEKQMIDQSNAQRAKYGLPPLAVDQSLEKTARGHAVWMTNNRAMQHSNQNVGENIAMGQHTPTEAFTDWMNSPGHRANILNSSYKRTGVAAYQTPDGTIYWCQQFLP